MARTFLGTGQVPYIGTPYQRPIQICHGGKVVPLYFDWNAYGASSVKTSLNVLVSLRTPDVKAQLLQQIASVYIDNTNSFAPIYVYCPDTKYTAIAQPNSAGWYPLYTNGLELWVIGQGFVSGQIPQTTIFVSDLFIPPYTDLEISQTQQLMKASSNISQGNILYNQNFGVPAIGDQIKFGSIPLNVFQTLVFFNFGQGFIYITGIYLSCFGMLNNPASNVSFNFESTGVSGVLFQATVTSGNIATGDTNINFVPIAFNSINLKLNGNETWQFRNLNTISQGGATLYLVYSTNPN
jgi:hypothetical protein